ncbi:MAG: right-handed parallel beta-helix repeat-containing protein, partial [Promethearchaeota archaeon]
MTKKNVKFKLFIPIIISFSLLIPFSYLKDFDVNLNLPPNVSQVIDIEIDGNAQLEAFCASNQSDGNSWATAFLIQNYTFESGSRAIWILHTDKYLIIRNCSFQSYTDGILLQLCDNIKIINCSFYNCDYSIDLSSTTNIEVNNCSINGGEIGIDIFLSRRCFLINCCIKYTTNHAILLEDSSNIEVIDNIINMCYNSMIMVWLSSENDLRKNIIFNCQIDPSMITYPYYAYGYSFPITIYGFSDRGNNNTISNSIIQYNNMTAIYINSKNNSILDNTITLNNGDGIHLSHDSPDFGLHAKASSNRIFNNNIISNNGNGILIDGGYFLEDGPSGNEIFYNNISHNNESGIVFKYPSNHNKAYNNTIYSNKFYCIEDTGYKNIYYNNGANCTIFYDPYIVDNPMNLFYVFIICFVIVFIFV